MVKKLRTLSVFGLGYLLGARAGRGHYEAIVAKAQELWREPRVQERLTQARSAAKDAAARAQDLAAERLPGSSASTADAAPAGGAGTSAEPTS